MARFSLLLVLLMSFIFVNAQQYEPKWIGSANLLIIEGDTIAKPLEKANVKLKTAHSAGKIIFGIGNTRKKCIIEGSKSPVSINLGVPFAIIVKCKNNESDPNSFIQVIKFERTKKERKTELASINWLETVDEGNMELIPFEADSYGKSSYILTFPELIFGEYGIRILNPDTEDEKIPVFHCFGIY